MRRFVPAMLLVVLPMVVGADDRDTKPLSTAEAAKKVNEQCLVEMQVKSTGKSGGRRVFLNSEANYRDGKNFTIVIDKEGLAKFKKAMIDDPATHFKDKTVRVKGKVLLYNNHPEIKLEEPEQIKIVDKK